jgi:RNA polymerase sigma-70 factor (ECF subfamily)
MELSTPMKQATEEQALTEAARAGDEPGFTAIANRYRAELRLHCYRMVGSLSDAEDLVQETLLKAWRARSSFEGRAAVRSWLYRIATNTCLDFLDTRKQRKSGDTVTSAEAQLGPQPHVAWLQPFPDHLLEGVASPEARLVSREALELGYLVALQCLPAKQRAALICCDVLDWSAQETAELLELSVAAVNSALQRARATLANEQETGRKLSHTASSEQERALLERYVAVTENLDIPGMAALLREDLQFSMPPTDFRTSSRDAAVKAWTHGPDGTPGGGLGSADFRDFRCLVTRVNRQPAVAIYRRPAAGGPYKPMALDVLTIRGDLVTDVMTFDLSHLTEQLRLPREL